MSGYDPSGFGAPPPGGTPPPGAPPSGGAPPPAGGGFGPPPGGGGGGFGPPPGGPPSAGPPAAPPPGGGGFGGSGGGESLGNIPFSPEEEETIRKMALFMRVSGGLMIANAALSLIGAVLKSLALHASGATLGGNLCGGVIGGLISGGLAFLLMQGAKAFQQVADTDGADQDYLATGFEKLKFYFTVKGVLVILAILLVCCFCLFGVIMGAGAFSQLRHM